MVIACWSAKGGVGTTVVAAALALSLGRRPGPGVVLIDLAGDLAAVLGMPEPPGDGMLDWLAAGTAVPADGLARLEVPVTAGVRLLHLGGGDPPREVGQRARTTRVGRATGATAAGAVGADLDRVDVLIELLGRDPRPVVVDCGSFDSGGASVVAMRHACIANATHSWLVTRACYLGLRRALGLSVRPSGVVLVHEAGRALGARDVEDVLDAPIVAQVPVDPTIARAVDAGLLASRVPRCLEQALRSAA